MCRRGGCNMLSLVTHEMVVFAANGSRKAPATMRVDGSIEIAGTIFRAAHVFQDGPAFWRVLASPAGTVHVMDLDYYELRANASAAMMEV